MVEKKTKAEKPEETPAEPTAEELEAAQQQLNGNWEFIDRTPSREEVAALLATLPEWWGVKPADYLDYVQGLPSDKKIKVPVMTATGKRKEERWFSVVTLYFGVAGRLQMLREAQELNGWRVNFVPEEQTPSGTPGFIDLGVDTGRIVYREYVEIWEPVGIQAPQLYTKSPDPDRPRLEPDQLVMQEQIPSVTVTPVGARRWFHGQEFELLGRRPGMAWVPYTGGSQAKGTNPFEKVETAARGRALAAWGFGVLPGSGVASLEEMLGVPANRQGMAGEVDQRPATGGGRREKPEELVAQILTFAEEARQLRGESEGWNLTVVRGYVREVANVDVATSVDQDGSVLEVDLTKVPPAALLLIRNKFKDRVVKLRDDMEKG